MKKNRKAVAIEPPQQTTAIDQAFRQALVQHEAGCLVEAERRYLAILEIKPDYPEVNYNLGVLSVQKKQAAAGLPYFVAALNADPANGQYWLSYVDALLQDHQLDVAKEVLALARQYGLQGGDVDALSTRLEAGLQADALIDSSCPAASLHAGQNKQPGRMASHKVKSPSPRDINKLADFFSKGRYTEAVAIASAMTLRYPRYGFGWKALGAMFKQMGQAADALLPMQKAAALSPGDVEAHYNLGVTLQELGRLEEAEASYRQALQINPNYADAHDNLGVTLQKTGRLFEAEASYRRAIQIRPDYAVSHHNLGDLLKELGRLDEACASYRRGLQINTDSAEAHYHLANLLLKLGRADEACSSYRRALQINPDYAEAHYNLGWTLKEFGRLDEACASYRRAIQINPGLASAHYNLGNLLKELGRLDDAEVCYRQTIQIEADFVAAYHNLGNILMELNHLDEAEASYLHALEIDPGYSESLLGLGSLYKDKGLIDKARDTYLQVLQINPDSLNTRYNLALIGKAVAGDENFTKLVETEKAAQKGEVSLSDEQMIWLHFALGKCYDDGGDFEKAFAHFHQGCQLKRATFNYHPDGFSHQVSEIIGIFDKDAIGRLSGAGNSSQLPIFILGMPRSGTTLTEQILASHPDVYGAGELPDLMRIVQQAGTAIPGNMHFLDQATLTVWGAQYVAGLKLSAPNALRITDKMPVNFLLLGLIHLMLPNAKIIHVKRNPADTCLSCFTQLFAGGHEYNYDLTELGRYYADYSRLMDHWRRVLPPGAFLDVNYEDIVADQEAQAPRMIEYCGLEWNDACIESYKTERQVRTASAVQVRQPMYLSSVGRWRHYEKFLGPLFDALGDLAPERSPC